MMENVMSNLQAFWTSPTVQKVSVWGRFLWVLLSRNECPRMLLGRSGLSGPPLAHFFNPLTPFS